MAVSKDLESSVKSEIDEHRRRLNEGLPPSEKLPPVSAYLVQAEASEEKV